MLDDDDDDGDEEDDDELDAVGVIRWLVERLLEFVLAVIKNGLGLLLKNCWVAELITLFKVASFSNWNWTSGDDSGVG